MRSLLPLAFLVLAAPLSAQQLWTVDDDGPADFTQIQAAIDAAADGDSILVRAGVYARITVDGKGLVIQGEGDPLIQVAFVSASAVTIRNLAADKSLRLRGFTTSSVIGAERETLVVKDCAGPVLFEDCHFVDSFGEAAVVDDCDSVSFVECVLEAAPTFASAGPFGSFFGFVTYDGLVAINSHLFLFDCDVSGSSGADAGLVGLVNLPPHPAGVGVTLSGSSMLASGCTFTGGSGGGSGGSLCYAGADGEPALSLENLALGGPSTANLLDSVLIPGTGGSGNCGMPDGVDAAAQEIEAGSSSTAAAGLARHFAPASPAVEGGSLAIHLEGQFDDDVIVFLALGIDPGIDLAPLPLSLHLAAPVASIAFGHLPSSGVLDISLPLPPLLFTEHVVFTGQALFVSSSGFFEGGPRTVMITKPGV